MSGGPADAEAVFVGGGETGALMRALDWAATPLGPVTGWPQSLRTAVSVMLASRFPMMVHWGPELIHFYNDGYAAVLQGKHPGALGAPAIDWWPEIWGQLEPIFEAVWRGETTYFEDTLVLPNRRGHVEECYFTFCHSPIRDESGAVGGVFVTAVETTAHVVARRRLATLGELASRTAALAPEASVRDVCEAAVAALQADASDIPVAALLLRDGTVAAAGVPAAALAPTLEAVARVRGGGPAETVRLAAPSAIDAGRERGWPGGPWPEPSPAARVLPVSGAASADARAGGVRGDGALVGDVAGVLVVGVSPRRPLDAGYLAFLDTAAEQVAQALAAAQASAVAREARAAAAAAQARLARVVEQAPVVFNTFVGPDHVFESANALFRRVTGKGSDVVGRPVREAQAELAGTGIYELLDRVYATGEPFVGSELPAPVDMDGDGIPEERFFNFVCQPVWGVDGRVEGIASVATDVTDLVRAREGAEAARAQAERTEARLRFALASARLGAWELDLAAGRMTVSDQCRANFGLPPADAPGAPRFDYPDLLAAIHPDDRPAMQDAVRDALARGVDYAAEYRVRWPDGTEHWVEAHGRAVHDDAGVPVRMAGVTQDVTERRRAGAERERLLAEAEGANRAKGEFLAVMSHELRTPLNAIGGYAELLELGLRGPVTNAQRADLARIQQSQKHLLGLINQVLNYTRVDAGAVRYDVTAVPVAQALGASEALVVPQARARGLTLVIGDCPPGLAAHADREKLQQILLNLLTNAVKFTEPGGEVRVTGAEREGAVAISVADTGVGVAADKLASIFEPFVQVDQRLTRPHEGVGLGLAISRELARGMGGELTVQSAPGVGSTFTLVLPRASTPDVSNPS